MTEIAPLPALATIFDRCRWSRLADGLAIGVALSLPWSTSITSLLIAVWLVALLPTLRPGAVVRELARPESGIPLLLCALVFVGMLWSQASLAEQLQALKGPHKLLVLPLLFLQFERSEKGYWVAGAFLLSCTMLLVVSWFLHLWPHQHWRIGPPGVPVKDYIVQSMEFVICTFAVGHLAVDAWRQERRGLALGMAALALAFLGNVAFAATGRSSLIAFAVLLVLFGLQRFGAKGTLSLVLGGILFAGVFWASSSYLRERTIGVVTELQRYEASQEKTSSGFRVEFWKKSVGFVAEAPILGHGTGSIPLLFQRVASGDDGIAAAVTGNPHDLTLEMAVQFGLIGAVVLYAMWIAHWLVFRGGGLVPWLGQAVVLQAVVGSLFLSFLLEFSHGWIYVFGVGVLGGMVRKRMESAGSAAEVTTKAAMQHS